MPNLCAGRCELPRHAPLFANVCLYVCMYIYVHTYIHTHTHTHTHTRTVHGRQNASLFSIIVIRKTTYTHAHIQTHLRTYTHKIQTAAAAGVPPSLLQVHSVRAGGAVVDMTLRPDRSRNPGVPAPLDVVSNLSKQIRDRDSALLKGRHTRLALSIELLAAYQVCEVCVHYFLAGYVHA